MSYTLVGGLAGMFLIALGAYLWTSKAVQSRLAPKRDYREAEADRGIRELEELLKLEAAVSDG